MPRPRMCVAAVACVLAVTALSTSARADTTEEEIERARAAVADIAQRWFDTTSEAARLEAESAATQQLVADARAEADRVQQVAQAQAIELYTGSSTMLAGVLDGDDALDSARRAELFARADDEARRAIDALESAAADLEAHRAELEQQRAAQAELAEELAGEQAALDDQLASLERQAAAEQVARAEAAKKQSPKRAPATRAAPSAAPAPDAGEAPVAPDVPPEPVPVAAPSGGGTHPRHDEPFLVCTRDRESRGDYGAVNPDGYYGAYQFAERTWNVTASQAGRIDLVGVLPSQASPYDQDELAWVLYEWQGNAPWNGRC